MKNRYGIFAGEVNSFYGGWWDFIDSYPSLEDARGAIEVFNQDGEEYPWVEKYRIDSDGFDWYQIIDLSVPILIETRGR